MSSDTVHQPSVALGTVFEVLAHPHRRYTLVHLYTMDGETLSLSALLEALSEHITISSDRLELELCHAHLPKLVDHGLIEYDARSETIRYHENERVESVLEFVQSEEEIL